MRCSVQRIIPSRCKRLELKAALSGMRHNEAVEAHEESQRQLGPAESLTLSNTTHSVYEEWEHG
jgi:hypothetical protein